MARMSRYRLVPTEAQETGLLEQCRHARYVWNLAVEQHSSWANWRRSAPGYVEQARQLTEARSALDWLRAGSQMVQQQALRDFAQAMTNYFAGTHRRPTWRKSNRDEGFRVVALKPGGVRRLNRRMGEVQIPKVGWVRFRWTRDVPTAKSYRIKRDRSGRWHLAFAAIPDGIPAPGNGEIVGIDRGVNVSAALSTGELLKVPGLRPGERVRLLKLQRRLARSKRTSNRRRRVKAALARLKAREFDRRKDWVEKLSTDLARRFDLIRVEDLKIKNMTRSARGTASHPGRNVRQKAGLNRAILQSGWGELVRRLDAKALARVERVQPAYTSQTCADCGRIARESRESQAAFRCIVCGHTDHADTNAARNIAAGRAVTARREANSVSMKREPQLSLLSV